MKKFFGVIGFILISLGMLVEDINIFEAGVIFLGGSYLMDLFKM